ncbi:hypothetical protein [Desulfotomaculum copahuensis]|nr:hypothetical protein [Desulfotomaculum copahuensis]
MTEIAVDWVAEMFGRWRDKGIGKSQAVRWWAACFNGVAAYAVCGAPHQRLTVDIAPIQLLSERKEKIKKKLA